MAADRVDTATGGVHLGWVTVMGDGIPPGVELPYVAPGYTYPAVVAYHVTGLEVGSQVVAALTTGGCVIIARVPTGDAA